MASHSRRRQQLDRVANACEQCKKRKVKCSGRNPCESCTVRRTNCTFKRAEKKVLVSESYLHTLERHYAKPRDPMSASESVEQILTPDFASSQSPSEANPVASSAANVTREELITNPLVSATSFYLKDTAGRFRFCGPSSTWSFSQRVFLLLKARIPHYPSPNLPFHVDGSTWELSWVRKDLDDATVLDGLPSLHDFLYLLNVLKYHSYQMLLLVEEEAFLPHLHEFYEEGLEKAKAEPLWFVQYLLVIALAKAFLATPANPKSPPGATFFQRAMSLMPDFLGLHRQPNLGIQILLLAGLYLVSVDMKDAAYAYISQSIRTCIIEGLHREPPSQFFGAGFANQCRSIWWSAYILDRQLSALVGAPISIQDSEITCSLPDSYDDSERGLILNMHVKLSRILGHILSSVYTADLRLRRSFITIIESVLREMADVLREIEDINTRTAHPTIDTISTLTSHLSLTCHQCIILATRPVFLYFLIKRLKVPARQSIAMGSLIPQQLRPLLETSLQSAKISLRTLLLLYEHSSLEYFLPFDLDNIFSSTFIVIIAHFVDPSLVPDIPNYITIVSRMLNEVVNKGNMSAHLRQKELDLLQQMIDQVVKNEERPMENACAATQLAAGAEENITPRGFDEWMGVDVGVSMSHAQVLDLAQQLNVLDQSAWDISFEIDDGNLLI